MHEITARLEREDAGSPLRGGNKRQLAIRAGFRLENPPDKAARDFGAALSQLRRKSYLAASALRERSFALGKGKIRDGGQLEIRDLFAKFLSRNECGRSRQRGNAHGQRKKPENPLDHIALEAHVGGDFKASRTSLTGVGCSAPDAAIPGDGI